MNQKYTCVGYMCSKLFTGEHYPNNWEIANLNLKHPKSVINYIKET